MRPTFRLSRLTGLVVLCVAAVAAPACSSVATGNGSDGSTDVPISDASAVDTHVGTDVIATQDVPAARDIVTPSQDVVTLPDVPEIIDVAPIDTGPRMLACGASTCTPDQVCCAMTASGGLTFMCATSCADASVTITCESPSDCGGNPCCAQASMGAGGGLGIGAISCGAEPTACPPAFSIATRMATTRLCTTSADCTSGAPGSTLPTCCTVNTGGGTIHACLATFIASLAPGQVTCP